VGPTAGLDAAAKRENPCPAENQTPVVQPVPIHYTDRAIPHKIKVSGM